MATDNCIDLVIFQAGACQVAVEARHVRASHGSAPGGPTTPCAESVLDLPPAAAGAIPRQRLTLRHAEGERDLLVGGPLELASVPIEHIHPLPPLLAARTYLAGLRALILAPGRQAVLLFDAQCLRYPEPPVHT